MAAFMTDSIYLHSDISTILRMDLFILLILVGLLVFKENINPNFYPNNTIESQIMIMLNKIINIAIIPFLFIFVYVLIYMYLNAA